MSNLNRKVIQNKTDHLLVQNELNKLKMFDSSYYRGKNCFEEDGTQNYLVFQPMYRYFNQTNNDYISTWKSKELSNRNITVPSAPNNFLNPSLEYLVDAVLNKMQLHIITENQ